MRHALEAHPNHPEIVTNMKPHISESMDTLHLINYLCIYICVFLKDWPYYFVHGFNI